MNLKLVRIFSLIFIFGCAGIKPLSDNTGNPDLYSPPFVQKIDIIKNLYKSGKSDKALLDLKAMDDSKFLPCEKALRRNLIGVILFSKQQYEQAIFNFDLAISTSKDDEALTSQINLNSASSYFKLGQMQKAFNIVEALDSRQLGVEELSKYHLLRYNLTKELGQNREAILSLIRYLGEKQSIGAIRIENNFNYLMEDFSKLSYSEKIRILDEFDGENFLCVGYLGFLEVEKLYYNGEKDSAKDLLRWVNNKAANFPELAELVSNFFIKIANYSQIDPNAIGVILPLSGEKSKYGKRAMLGIDYALSNLNKKLKGNKKLKLFIEDSKGSGAVGAFNIKGLIDKYHVSVIIGGLFSNEAIKEYNESKKHSVFFISLSQIYTSKEQKDHLLLEIPGSVESQIEQLFSPQIIETVGKKGAILYPNNDRGAAYVNEFWAQAQTKGVEVTGALSYENNITDYRDPVANLLGLKFIRERQEELDLYKDVYSQEKHSSTKRIQTLPPQIDFNWIFIPSLPNEALQILPSFLYYDAFKVNFIGNPSWQSPMLAKESIKWGKLYFISDGQESEVDQNFVDGFSKLYKKIPKIIEMQSFDAMNIANKLLSGEQEITTRDDLDIYLKGINSFVGITGKWTLNESIWIKNMSTFKLYRGEVKPFESSSF